MLRNYHAMLNREGPKALGSRPLPVGKENCFEGLTFVQSGEFDTLTKEQIKDLIMRYGGRLTGSVSGKTTHLLRGRDAGQTKTAKAEKLGTKIIDEDGFYALFDSAAAEQPNAEEKMKESGQSKAKDSLWVDRYRPQTLKDIVGNKETIRKVSAWLENCLKQNFKKGSSQNDDIETKRSVLLSGPPGIGKTSSALVIARTHGFEPLELNASDGRSKKILQVLVLIMDEVDGMTGGDRGGSAELASLIRKTKIPVICICNDVRSDKVKPLLNVCYDARFRRTPAAQIRSRLMTIAHREGLKVQANAIDQLVEATHNDMRQMINILSTFKLAQDSLSYDQAKALGQANEKYEQLNVFDIALTLLSSSSSAGKSLSEKYDYYFHDFSLAPLMIWENYLRVTPAKAEAPSGDPNERARNEMRLMAKAAEAFADGDLVDRQIHGTLQQWSLMPVHSIFSCVRPTHYIAGRIQGRPQFPQWLGQNSKANKHMKMLNDIRYRMRLRSSANRYEVRQNYVPTFVDRMFDDLKESNVDEVIAIMDEYYMQRDNLDALNELIITSKKPMAALSTAQKTAFTRTYNSQNHPILFQVAGEPIKKKLDAPAEDREGEIFGEDPDFGMAVSDEESSGEDLGQDRLISESKIKRRPRPSSSSSSGRLRKKQRTKK
ncbi:replication factor RFC1 C terminal domain-containing protein [Zychaea mexicana]|uniref:replication factor RFC1 C terminal domain-containing protein n=1 Tax=Zychaea mexicana TaxID=64656 RepID=UPI0022FE7365|nr:replication factor RFC1 C terminal domain-containing protein [Zychaea mexicana]KAI9495659.1 replication factor RFC1 C terminal domain-containing protein [Zychaea mexicana]